MRLDTWLVQHGYFPSRQRAQLAIKAGQVLHNGAPASRASQPVQPADCIEVLGDALPYVSQGGLKLEKAILTFQLDFTGKRVLDAGASTGGFTDCALKHGATRVYAVDVGSGQLAHTLRHHPQVVFYEKLDVRNLTLEQLENEPVDAIVADLSFISLTHILQSFPPLLRPGGFILLLIKPQFELEQRRPLKGGIVKDKATRELAVDRVLAYAKEIGFQLKGVVETTVNAPSEKNVEFLVWMVR